MKMKYSKHTMKFLFITYRSEYEASETLQSGKAGY